MRIQRHLNILLAVCLFPLTVYATNSEVSDWKLKVAAEKANIRLEANVESPVVITLQEGAILESYGKEGEWFRVIMGPDEEGYSFIGYIHFEDVDVIEEKKSEESEFWDEEPDSFQGIGLRIKLSGGLNYFSSGDIGKGTQGFYDSRADYFSSAGYALDKRFKSFHTGFDISGDIIFFLKPQIGVGLGVGYIYARRIDFFQVSGENNFMDRHRSIPEITVIPIKLELFFSFPLNRLFSLSFSGGPALYLTEYTYFLSPNWKELSQIGQKANAKSLGFHGGIGLEVKLDQRAAFLIEGQGRYAKISNFMGKETKYRLVPPGEEVILKEEGTLYYMEDEKFPYLAIRDEVSSGSQAGKKAIFDLSGFCIRVGLIYKF